MKYISYYIKSEQKSEKGLFLDFKHLYLFLNQISEDVFTGSSIVFYDNYFEAQISLEQNYLYNQDEIDKVINELKAEFSIKKLNYKELEKFLSEKIHYNKDNSAIRILSLPSDMKNLKTFYYEIVINQRRFNEKQKLDLSELYILNIDGNNGFNNIIK